jgi:hypothetical protein
MQFLFGAATRKSTLIDLAGQTGVFLMIRHRVRPISVAAPRGRAPFGGQSAQITATPWPALTESDPLSQGQIAQLQRQIKTTSKVLWQRGD